MKNLFKGSLILTTGNLFVRVAGHAYRVLMGRMLSPFEYGLLNLALPLHYLVIILTSAGVAPSIAKFVSEYRAKGEREMVGTLAYSTLLFYMAVGLALTFAFVLISPTMGTHVFHDPKTVTPLRISALAIVFGFGTAVFTGLFQGHKRMDLMAITLSLQQVLRIVFAVVLVLAGARVTGAILGSSLGFMATLPLAYLFFRGIGGGFGGYSPLNAREVFAFSLPISATALASFALAYVDILFLGFYRSTEEVGIYSAASPTSRLILAFSTALYATLLPSIAGLKARNKGKEIREYVRSAYRILMFVFLPLLAISYLFSTSIIILLFGGVYAGAAGPFRILLVGAFFFGIFNLNSGVFQGLGRPAIPMRILMLAAFLDVFLNVALIPRYALMGAAFATATSMAFAGITSMVLLPKALSG